MFASTIVASLLVARSVSAVALEARSPTVALQPRAPAATITAPGPVGLLFPYNRGWEEATDNVAPCGGYRLAGRSSYPITNGDISLKLQQEAEDIEFSWSSSTDPQADSDFTTILSTISTATPGTRCLTAPNFADLGVAAGDKITFRISYTTYITATTKGKYFQCADLNVLSVADYEATSPDYTCTTVNTGSTATDLANIPVTSAASSTPSTGSSSSSGSSNGGPSAKVSPVGAGFIGAAVTLVVAIAVLAALRHLGYISIAKKAAPQTWDDMRGGQRLDDAASFTSGAHPTK